MTFGFFVVLELALGALGPASSTAGGSPMGHLAGPVPPWMQADDDLLWRFRPGLDVAESGPRGLRWSYGTNVEGFRGAPPSAGDEAEIVLCAGDSVTAGYGVGDDRTYPTCLQRELRAHGHPDAVVVNTGVNGYSSEQGRALLSRTLPRYRPDVVILGFGINDDWLSSFPDRALMESSRARSLQRAFARSATYRLLRTWIVGLKMRRAATAGRLAARVPVPRYRENLEAMLDLAHRARARAILLAPTTRWEDGSRRFDPGREETIIGAPMSEYRRAMHEVADAAHVPCLDLPLLSGRLPDSRERFVDWCHPDAQGLEMLARELAVLVEGALTDGPPAA